jgi:hypothetical protein
MKPVYFPFTYINASAMKALVSCFGKCILYQPSRRSIPEKMKKWEAGGLLDIRVPIEGDEDRLDAVSGEFLTWARGRQDSDIALWKALGDRIPFFDESSVSQIRSDVEKRAKRDRVQTGSSILSSSISSDRASDVSPEKKNRDRLFSQRVFLLFAQEFDMKHDEIDRDIRFVQQREKALFLNLSGEKEAHESPLQPDGPFVRELPNSYMISKRLEAWSHLMRVDRQASPLMVTGNRSVWDHVMDGAPDSELIGRFEIIPVDVIPASIPKDGLRKQRSDSLLRYLEKLAQDKPSEPPEDLNRVPFDSEPTAKVSLTISLIPNASPTEFFDRFFDPGTSPADPGRTDTLYKHTLLGRIRF